MTTNKIKRLFSDFEHALTRLREGINTKIEADIVIDGVIQRFEFTFELSWKLMQSFLDYQGIICKSPRQTIKEAFKLGLFEDGDAWIDMLIDRNKTSHIYDEHESRSIYNKIISKHIFLLNSFFSHIRKEIHDLTDANL